MSLGQDGPPTRTRMPEGHTAAPGRRAQPRRALVTVVGVVVLLIAAIAFANRGSHGSPTGTAGSGAGSGSGGSSGAAGSQGAAPATTAPSGERPVTGKSAAGIPAGFAHSAQGAQSAAANYAVALGGVDMFNTNLRHAIVATVYAADVTPASQGQLDKVYSDPAFLQRIGLQPSGAAPNGMTFVSRTNPAGTKLEKYDTGTATVSIWYSSLFGLAGTGSTNPVTESWFTNTFEMKWTAGDWKITDFQQKDGPTPVGRDQAASSAQDMANAVNGFGGFTYAR